MQPETTSINMFSDTPNKFYANIMSAWISTSLALIFMLSLGEYEMISASAFVFAFLFILMIYVNVYHLIMKLNPGIDVSELKYFKYIPISIIGFYHGVILNNMIHVLLNKEHIINTLNVYNINNYKMHQDELDAEYAFSMIRNIGIVSFTTHFLYSGIVVVKLWHEEKRALTVIDWNKSVIAYSKRDSRSSITNFDTSTHCNKNIYNNCFWISMSKFSHIAVLPLLLFSVIDLDILPNILYTLFIDSGREILIVACIDLGLLVASFAVYGSQRKNTDVMFARIILLNIFVVGLYVFWCSSSQYGFYEFIKVQDYALTYTCVYSIIMNIYIYQVCNINYLVNSDYTYKSIPNAEPEDPFIDVDDSVLSDDIV